jgi:serine/threonine-protein kinase
MAGAAVLLVAVEAYLGLRSRAAADLDGDLVAVAPFDVVGEGLQSWREGMVDLLARHLDGAGPRRTVAPTLTIKRWEGRADPASAAALGRRTGAGLAVFGQLLAARGDSVRLTASVMDVASRGTLGDVDLRGAADDVERLADSATVGLLAELGRTRPVGAARHTSLGTQIAPGDPGVPARGAMVPAHTVGLRPGRIPGSHRH